METVINSVLAEMQPILESHQFKRLAAALKHAFGLKQLSKPTKTSSPSFLPPKGSKAAPRKP